MKILKWLFKRTTIMILLAVVEIVVMFMALNWFGTQTAWVEALLRVLSLVIVLAINKNSRHLSSDMMWIFLIILLPVVGTALYLLLGANLISSRTYRGIVRSTADAKRYYRQDPEVLEEMCAKMPAMSGQFRYISENAGFPFYRNTGFDYYGLGEEGYPAILEALRGAREFIFLEYFIIEEGKMWNGILDILEEKARAGLDVRVIYDDMGSIGTLPYAYARELEKRGIRCLPFNRINPLIGIIMNHRDHRKIMVVDGQVAFSGGINLADEYINEITKYGHWKDNVIRVTGEAVWSYTVMFLTHWNALRPEDADFGVFRRTALPGEADGYVAAYGETPLSQENTAQNIYVNILNQAVRYCYIITPYLIIDTELENALILAAARGVDVRILTPGIPDNKLVWCITRSYYRQLIEGGVRIFEYTPGFVHAKVFVADDRIATVGTVNLDYRSLYLHFENGTCLCDSEKVMDIRRDWEQAAGLSKEITKKDAGYHPLSEFVLSVLRVFAPLM